MEKKVHVLISGRVQGVWFRANTKDQADLHGIKGWVKNTVDGKVEAVFQGPIEKVDDLIKWCHQGSPSSHVDHVDVSKFDSDESFDSFTIRY